MWARPTKRRPKNLALKGVELVYRGLSSTWKMSQTLLKIMKCEYEPLLFHKVNAK